LFAGADAIDRIGPVVGNQDRAVVAQDDIVGTTEIGLVALEPAGSEHFAIGREVIADSVAGVFPEPVFSRARIDVAAIDEEFTASLLW
jgi:hypothetical protein